MTDVAATPDLLPAPAADAPPPAAPTVDEAPNGRRRRLVLLFLLLSLLLVLVAFGLWYFLFRQPVENLIPNLDLTKPPTYQLSLYGASKPLGVAVSSDGSRIYVTQGSGDQATLVLDGSGTKLATLAPPSDVVAHATQLYVAINPTTGDVYATDRAAGKVFIYAADGSYKGVFEGPGTTVAQPFAIAFGRDGTLYLSDVGGEYQKVHVFGPDGAWLRDLGSQGLFLFPNGLAVDGVGNVYVADSNNGRVLVFDQTGAQIGQVMRGPADGQLSMPRGLAIDGQGRLYVADTVAQSIQLFRVLGEGATAPAFLTRFGSEGTAEAAFEYPNGIAVDGRGRVFIADWNNDRLQVWGY